MYYKVELVLLLIVNILFLLRILQRQYLLPLPFIFLADLLNYRRVASSASTRVPEVLVALIQNSLGYKSSSSDNIRIESNLIIII
jgi:hypothetical protein